MKNRTKLITVICSMILLVGVLTSVSQRIYGIHMGRISEIEKIPVFFPPKVNGIRVDITAKEEHEKELEEFQNIEIKIDEALVRLIPGNTFKVYICSYTDLWNFHYENKNGILKIGDEKNAKYTKGRDYFTTSGLWNIPENRIDIYYPSGTQFQTVKIFNEYGDTRINNIATNTLDLNMHSGNAIVENIRAKNMDLKVDYGDLTLACPSDFQGGQAAFALHSGDLSVTDLYCKNEIKIQSECGGFMGKRLSVVSLDVKSHSGDVELINIQSDKITVSNNYGDIGIQSLTAQELQIESQNGDVNVSGDLGINTTVTSQNGDVKLNLAGEKSAYEYMLSSNCGEFFVNGTAVEIIMNGERSDSIQGGAGAKNKIKAQSSNGDIYLSFGKK